MDIFWRLVLSHLISDFTLQTNKVAAWKRNSIWGVFFHSAVFFSVAAILTIGRTSEIWFKYSSVVLNGWACITVLTVLHFLEDNWRVWTIAKLNSPDSFGFFLWDQFIHYLMIFIFTPLDEHIAPEKFVIVAIIYVIATHFLTVFIYYIEKDVFGSAVTYSTHLKYYSIIERLVIVSLFLLPGQWWLFMIFLLVIKSIVYAFKKIYDFSWIHIILNYSMSIILGLAGRIILYV